MTGWSCVHSHKLLCWFQCAFYFNALIDFRMGSAYFLQLALLMAVCMEVVDAVGSDTSWQTIETRLMRGYDRKHRPVKQASTTTNVTVLMMVNHIEEIVS